MQFGKFVSLEHLRLVVPCQVAGEGCAHLEMPDGLELEGLRQGAHCHIASLLLALAQGASDGQASVEVELHLV